MKLFYFSPRFFQTDPFLLFGLALLVRLLAAWPQQQPNYMDAAYYYVNALNLVAGRGFVEDFVWNYLGQPGLPPQPSHLYWMPLTSILAVLGMLIGGISYRAAQIPFILLSAVLAPLCYGVAVRLSGRPRHGWLAGLLAIFSGFYFPVWTAIDNFTPFALCGALALFTASLGIRHPPIPNLQLPTINTLTGTHYHPPPFTLQLPIINYQLSIINYKPAWLLLAGICGGLAHLARADGPLLLIAVIFTYAILLLRQPLAPSLLLNFVIRLLLPLVFGYLLVMTPWFSRNWQVLGAPLPAAGSQAIWLNNYDDLFSYNRELSPRTFFAQGLNPILQGRWWALTTNLQTVLAVWGMIFLTPFALLGGWQLRRQLLIQLAGWYALALFLAMTFIFAFPGARGGLFHSGTALLPFIYAAALVGLDQAVDWLAARRRHWRGPVAKQVFGLGLVLLAIGLTCFIYYGRVLKNDTWNQADALYPAIVAWITQQNSTATVMIGNPPAYRYHGGGLSVVIPNEDLPTTLRAARRYGVDYLILDSNHPVPLAQLYQNPQNQPNLTLVQTFQSDSTNPIYIFKITQPQ